MFNTLYNTLVNLFKEKTYTDMLLVHPHNLVDKVVNQGTIIYGRSTRNQLLTMTKWLYDCDFDMAEFVVDTSIKMHVEPLKKAFKYLDPKTREKILKQSTEDALKAGASEAEAR